MKSQIRLFLQYLPEHVCHLLLFKRKNVIERPGREFIGVENSKYSFDRNFGFNDSIMCLNNCFFIKDHYAHKA